MEYRYTEIPKEKAKKLREKFIESFVDTTNWQYEKLIRDVKADDIIKHYEGYMVSYLWCCLRDDITKRRLIFEEAAELLKKNERRGVYNVGYSSKGGYISGKLAG